MFWESKKSEKEDEKITAYQSQAIENLSDRQTLFRFLLICVLANAIIWFSVLIFPSFVHEKFSRIFDVSDKLAIALLGFPFGFGLFAAYSLCRLKFSDVEDNKNLESDMMSSFNYQSNSTKRWFVWLFSIVVGVLNLAFLILVNLMLSNNL